MPTATASIDGYTLASTSAYETVEGNIYFPPISINKSVFSPSSTHTTCAWKGVASYYNITVDGKTIKDAAWYYPLPKSDKIRHIKDYVAFYKNKVEVTVN